MSQEEIIKQSERDAIEYFSQYGIDISTKPLREALPDPIKGAVLAYLMTTAQYYMEV